MVKKTRKASGKHRPRKTAEKPAKVDHFRDGVAALRRIAAALEALAPPPARAHDFSAASAWLWRAETGALEPVTVVNRVPLALLKGIDRVRDILLENTRRFANGLPANNALLWGARGMGKSSLVKAVHGAIDAEMPGALALIEIHREDIPTLAALLQRLRAAHQQRLGRYCLLFCDDLSFESTDTTFKSLKAVLEGGIEGRPDNVLFYATSNRRHLMPRDMMENEQSSAVAPGEAVEEKVSLSDRFGLWLGFHACSQDDYFAMVEAYARAFGLAIQPVRLRAEALEWSMTRGARSGRVAWQFIQDLAGRSGKRLDFRP
jgi:predicted AAA+ superfamily ATPase